MQGEEKMSTPELEIRRWTAKCKIQLVLESPKGRTTVAEAARRYDLKPNELETWVQDGIEAGKTIFEPGRGIFENNTSGNSPRFMLPLVKLSWRSKP